MTDARLRGEWLTARRFADLSDAAWRVFTSALMWSAEQGTDGRIDRRYVRTLHPSFDDLPDAYAELEAAGLWEQTDDGFVMVDWSARTGLGQSTAEQVEGYRESSRARQRQYRARQKASTGGVAPLVDPQPLSSARVTRNATRNVTQDVGPLNQEISIEGAYATREVTRNADEPPPRFCPKHPNGSGGAPCGPCRDARIIRDDWERNHSPKPPATLRPRRVNECAHDWDTETGRCCIKCGHIRAREAVA